MPMPSRLAPRMASDAGSGTGFSENVFVWIDTSVATDAPGDSRRSFITMRLDTGAKSTVIGPGLVFVTLNGSVVPSGNVSVSVSLTEPSAGTLRPEMLRVASSIKEVPPGSSATLKPIVASVLFPPAGADQPALNCNPGLEVFAPTAPTPTFAGSVTPVPSPEYENALNILSSTVQEPRLIICARVVAPEFPHTTALAGPEAAIIARETTGPAIMDFIIILIWFPADARTPISGVVAHFPDGGPRTFHTKLEAISKLVVNIGKRRPSESLSVKNSDTQKPRSQVQKGLLSLEPN